MAAGSGFGDNTVASIITRGLAETIRLGVALGAKASTLAGLAGVGDLVATCTSELSRNRTFGERLGTRAGRWSRHRRQPTVRSPRAVKSCTSVRALAAGYDVEMPLTRRGPPGVPRRHGRQRCDRSVARTPDEAGMSEIGVGRFEDYGDSTRSVSAVAREHVAGQPMQLGPIFAAPYQLSADEGSESDTYARASNPGWRGLESALAALEKSGPRPRHGIGDVRDHRYLAQRPRRGGYRRSCPRTGITKCGCTRTKRLAPLGITVREVSTLQMGDASFVDLLDASPGRVVVVRRDTVQPRCWTWSTFRVLADVCHRSGALLIVDNTTGDTAGSAPRSNWVPTSWWPAVPQALSGHSDLLMGYVATSDTAVSRQIERERLLSGTVLGPFETWLAHRSLGTAGLRFGRQCDNALALAEMLVDHKAVRSVRYPGLRGDPSYATASGQMNRFGGLVRRRVGFGSGLPLVRRSERSRHGCYQLRRDPHDGGSPCALGRSGQCGVCPESLVASRTPPISWPTSSAHSTRKRGRVDEIGPAPIACRSRFGGTV